MRKGSRVWNKHSGQQQAIHKRKSSSLQLKQTPQGWEQGAELLRKCSAEHLPATTPPQNSM